VHLELLSAVIAGGSSDAFQSCKGASGTSRIHRTQ